MRSNPITQYGVACGGMLLSLAAACATAGPSRELIEARSAYQDAQHHEAAKLRPDELVDAQQALERAETAHNDEPGSAEERHLAYLAERRAQIAMSRGKLAAYERGAQAGGKQLISDAKGYAEDAKGQLTDAHQQLQQRDSQIAQTHEELEAEREKRIKAEELAAKALDDLKQVAMVKEEARGYVITLSGSVLFRSDEAELLSTAKVKLEQVAEALKQQDNHKQIVVEGHTDARGSDSYNAELSLHRAQAVRDYLASKGLDGARLEAKGVGEAQPVGDNNTPEGRANNRRVEIVVQPNAAQSGA